ncbi:TetR family transcriptional regulator [Knoellia sinensis KCTC 19936]|uniref:TetR family transcriptional regulator n=1 Tax=Knoellia sinensis KCTC 19936 TaxID=1385520 RepID=A0A0A0J602_9MICO|nr:TetR family transcriptional regulator [Knoellia sinensis KCTC 19936]
MAWGTHAQPQSGPRRGMSHEKIVAKAIEIADEQGLSGVTMQRLAESLGFTTMSLYRYVANKDELFMLMVGSETILPEAPAGHDDWKAGLREWAGSLREMYAAHPWLLDIRRGPTSVLMPASVALVDQGLQVLAPLELDDRDRISIILIVSSYVSSFAALERDLAGQEDLEFGPQAMAELGSVITPERLPFAAPLILSGGYVGGPPGEDHEAGVGYEYELGLDLLIEGLSARKRT